MDGDHCYICHQYLTDRELDYCGGMCATCYQEATEDENYE